MKKIKWNNSYIFYIVIFLLLISRLFWSIVTVEGHSMDPTYYSSEKLFMVKNTTLSRFDVVVAKKNDKLIVKRIIGLPGDTIEYDKDVLKINGEVIEEKYLKEYLTLLENNKLEKAYDYNINYYNVVKELDYFTNDMSGNNKFSITLKDNEYYILGDNRPISDDSRISGTFTKEYIIGEIKFEIPKMHYFI